MPASARTAPNGPGEAHPPALLTPEDVAARLAISVKSVYRLAASGSIGSVRVGGLLRFRPESLRDYIEQHTRPSDNPRSVLDRRLTTTTDLAES